MAGPLKGIKILDFTRLLPGPFATMMLADLGAEVVKVENISSDDYTRDLNPPMYFAVNRGKRSLQIEFKRQEGLAVLDRLVPQFHAAIEGFRPGVADALGIGPDRLRSLNPAIVTCSISGYGNNGPDRMKAGHDLNYVARSGWLSTTGTLDGKLGIPGTQVADFSSGIYAALGMVAAIREAENTGKGKHIDVSLADSALSFAICLMTEWIMNSIPPAPAYAFLLGSSVCYNIYACKDGHVTIGALEPKFWKTFCDVMARPDLVSQNYAPADNQGVHREVAKFFAPMTKQEIREKFRDADCCVEPVNTIAEALADPQFKSRGTLSEYSHPKIGVVPKISMAFRYENESISSDLPAPDAGQHTKEILLQSGFSVKEIDLLYQKEIIR